MKGGSASFFPAAFFVFFLQNFNVHIFSEVSAKSGTGILPIIEEMNSLRNGKISEKEKISKKLEEAEKANRELLERIEKLEKLSKDSNKKLSKKDDINLG